MNGYRKELKFIVTDAVLGDVANRISPLMRRDSHQKGDHYNIRSIYLDSPGLTCYRENRAGVSPREKYRIRSYDCSDALILAEIKIRHRDTISKMSTPISRSLYETLLAGDPGRLSSELDKAVRDAGRSDPGRARVLEKYLAATVTRGYSPKTIVCYERSAFVYDICNVRITFDRNVFASDRYDRFFDPELTGRPALEGGQHILEIKYDEFLPDEIKAVLAGMRLGRCSSSKYAKCMEVCDEF